MLPNKVLQGMVFFRKASNRDGQVDSFSHWKGLLPGLPVYYTISLTRAGAVLPSKTLTFVKTRVFTLSEVSKDYK